MFDILFPKKLSFSEVSALGKGDFITAAGAGQSTLLAIITTSVFMFSLSSTFKEEESTCNQDWATKVTKYMNWGLAILTGIIIVMHIGRDSSLLFGAGQGLRGGGVVTGLVLAALLVYFGFVVSTTFKEGSKKCEDTKITMFDKVLTSSLAGMVLLVTIYYLVFLGKKKLGNRLSGGARGSYYYY